MTSKPTVVIIDYGVGNRGSILNMVRSAGGVGVVSSDREAILRANRLILPGVGAFDACIERFNQMQLSSILSQAVFDHGIPILGLCVGMQMLFEGSDEGRLPGLGWMKGRVRHLSTLNLCNGTKIPNMGWSRIHLLKDDPIFKDQPEASRFYFAHSYFCDPMQKDSLLAEIAYGGKSVPVVARNQDILGIQFHPEKSHLFGLKLMQAFITGS